jgi:hypothetical protein
MSLSGIKISELQPYNIALNPDTTDLVVNVQNETFKTNLNRLQNLTQLNISTDLIVNNNGTIANLTAPTLNSTTGTITNLTNTNINSNRGTFSSGLTGDLQGTVTGNLSGNARTAGWFNTARTFSLTGDVQSIVNVDTDLRTGLTLGTQIQANTINNSNIRNDASIAGTKIVSQFGAQSIFATGNLDLSANSTTNNIPFTILRNTGNSTTFPVYFTRKSRGETGSVINGDALGGLYFQGLDNQNTVRSGAAILSVTTGTPTGTSPSNSFLPASLTFYTSPSSAPASIPERMRITPDGSVGIGTTLPGTTLEVRSTTPSTAVHPFRTGLIVSGEGTNVGGRIGMRVASDIEAPNLFGYRTRGTLASPTAVQSGDILLSLGAISYDGTSWVTGANINVAAAENWTSTNRGADIIFNTVGAGVSQPFSEKMRIIANGNVGIGITNPAYTLDVAGIIRAQATAGAGDCFIIGNDTKLVDISIANICSLQGLQNPDRAGIRLGSAGPTLYGSQTGFLGIGNTSPGATLHLGNGANANTELRLQGLRNGNWSSSLLTFGDELNSQRYWMSSRGTNENASASWRFQYYHPGTAGPGGADDIWRTPMAVEPTDLNAATYGLGLKDNTVYINSSNNVGIGRTNPGYKLDVLGGIRASGGTSTGSVALVNGDASNPGYIQWHRPDGTTRIGYMGWSNSGANNLNLTLENAAVFSTNGGNTGINCTNPSQNLEVGGYARVRGLATNNNTYTNGGEFAIKAVDATNDPSMTFHSQTGVRQGYIQFGDNFARIRSEVANSIFYIGTNSSDDLILAANGNLGIGINPTFQLQLQLNSAAKPTSTAWTVASDVRLKENIALADTSRCLEIVKTLPLKRYTWKDNIYNEVQVKDRTKIGWIAQDVQQVFPKGVTQAPMTFSPTGLSADNIVIEDCLSLDADQIYATLYGAVQELIKRLEVLESKV